ncbi:hypothetical protein KXR63_15140 [Stutzerimonas chloritidismutans]|uniref:hypothetical protein n=1 Tax=Stutzerimonas chloritidismutans TaxID=203192 RepID=UPI003F1678E9
MNDSAPPTPFDVQHWPRDFDIRAEYAEQQELLDDATNRTPDNDNPGDATHE